MTNLHTNSSAAHITLPTLLSLDLGTHTGWAIRHTDNHITSGTAHFKPRKDEGRCGRYRRFAIWLNDLLRSIGETCETGKIDTVYFEQVHRHKGTHAAHVYGGLESQVGVLCEHYKIPYRGLPVNSIKKFISGKGNATKDEVISSIKARGHNPVDDNEADALAILYLAISRHPSGSTGSCTNQTHPITSTTNQLNLITQHHA